MSLRVENLKFAYKDNEVLKGIGFEVKDGEFVSILGPNGVGKSTLFKCILKLLEPGQGEVFVDDEPLKDLTPAQVARKIAYIPQYHTPIFNYTVLDMVLMGTTAQMGRFSMPKEKQVKQSEEVLDMLGIGFLKDRGISNISGGERQLVLIARAMAQQAKILVMDEPSASLDFGNRIRLMKTIKGLTKNGYTVIQSTHDPEQAYFYSNKILAMYAGEVIAFGYPDEVVNNKIVSKLYGLEVDVINVERHVVACVPKDLRRTDVASLANFFEGHSKEEA